MQSVLFKIFMGVLQAIVGPLLSYLLGKAKAKKEVAENAVKDVEKANEARAHYDGDSGYADRLLDKYSRK